MDENSPASRERWKSGYKDTVRKQLKRWQLANPDKVRAQQQRSRNRQRENLPSLRAKWSEQNRHRRETNPEKVKADKKKSYLKMRREHPERVRQRERANRKRYEENWARRMVTAAKQSSKKRGHSDLSIVPADIDALWEKQHGKCYWVGVPMLRVRNNILMASVDRLDNTVGYTPNNIVLCTWGANRARNDATVEVFREFVALIRSSANMVEQARKAGIPVRTIPLPAETKKD